MRNNIFIILTVLVFLSGCGGDSTNSDPDIPEIKEISGNCNWNKSPIHVKTGVYTGQTNADLIQYCEQRLHHGANKMGAVILYLFNEKNPLYGVNLMGWKNDCGRATAYIERSYIPVVIVSKLSDLTDECTVERKK